MTDEEVMRLFEIEHACLQAKCDRNCSCCDIVQEQETLDVLHKKAMQLIEENAKLFYMSKDVKTEDVKIVKDLHTKLI